MTAAVFRNDPASFIPRASARGAGLFAAALLLALAVAAPAAADRRVHVINQDFVFEELVTPAVYGFQCSGPVYHGILNGHESLVLWLENDFNPFWIHGQYVIQGSDYFSTAPGMGGGAVSGPFRLTAHLSDHQPGPPESWREIVTGILWNVHAPGAGSIFNDTLGIHRSVEVSPAGLIYSVIRQAVGHHAFDVAELCESLGYTLLP
jgi:hypothetical protein